MPQRDTQEKGMRDKKTGLELIESNVETYGYHVYLVSSKTEPRYAYTIGLNDKLGIELIFAGGIFYLKEDLYRIFDSIIRELKRDQNIEGLSVTDRRLGTFTLSKVHDTWSQEMLLGAYDYYQTEDIAAYQIKPDMEHTTLDIPDMSVDRKQSINAVWKWLDHDWDLPVPKNSTATTNLDALMGKPITEVMRWEVDEWEMFAGSGPDILKEDMRVVPVGTILGIDASLSKALSLEVGKGIWRESATTEWNNWN
ncbi:MAG: DUF4262 domain-containing protein [Bacteroidota bacterium]